MIWKDWPYWLKGAIIAVSIPIVVFIVNLFADIVIGTSGEMNLFFFLIIATPAIPIFNLFLSPSIPYNITYIIFFVSTLIIYFILGSVIGWLAGKRKKSIIKNKQLIDSSL